MGFYVAPVASPAFLRFLAGPNFLAGPYRHPFSARTQDARRVEKTVDEPRAKGY